MSAFAVKGAAGRRVHMYVAGPETACGQSVDVDRWTVRPTRLVGADQWCVRCWEWMLA